MDTADLTPLDRYRTLLLDSAFRPIKVIHWTRALCLQFQDKVITVETYDREVRSPTQAFPVPAVIALKQYLRFRPLRVRYSKRHVFIRDDFTCQYCGATLSAKALTIDHVIPSSQGGKTIFENVVAACEACNHRKGNRTPEQAKMPLRSTPRRPTAATHGTLAGMSTTPAEWEDYLVAAG